MINRAVIITFPAALEALHVYSPISFSVVLKISNVLLLPHSVITQSPSSELIIEYLLPDLKSVLCLVHSISGRS